MNESRLLEPLPSRLAAESGGDDAWQLQRASQALLDAVTDGDKAVFGRTLDPEGLFSDEKGNVRTGAAGIQKTDGLRPGYSEYLRMVDRHIRIRGDVRLLSGDAARRRP